MSYCQHLIFRKNSIFEEDLLDGGKRGENKYLRHLTYEGAKKRYGEITTGN